jgi:hypothetical protein
MDIHVGSEELHDDPPLILGSDCPGIKPSVGAIESFDSNSPRKLLSRPNRMPPSLKILISVVRMKTPPGICSEVGGCLSSIGKISTIHPDNLPSLRKRNEDMGR